MALKKRLLSPDARKRHQVYMRKWRTKNPGYQRKWRAKNPERTRELNKNWQVANLERVRELNKKWNATNPKRRREFSKKWHPITNKKQFKWILRARKFTFVVRRDPNSGEPVRFPVNIICKTCGLEVPIGEKYWSHRRFERTSSENRVRFCESCGVPRGLKVST